MKFIELTEGLSVTEDYIPEIIKNLRNGGYLKNEKEIIQKIIDMAEEFECCPECGSQNLIGGGHLCGDCKERVAVPDEVGWFVEHLRLIYRV